MERMRLGTFLGTLFGLAFLLMAGVVNPASAQEPTPEIIQKDCDTLSFVPPRVRVTFAVINLGPVPVCGFELFPVAAGGNEPCEIFECSVPPEGWTCNLNGTGGARWDAAVVNGSGCIGTGEKVEGFDFIIDPPYCCYRVVYYGPGGAPFYTEQVCFQCESPTPAVPSTWGLLKARYR
jgi:hypothetical protein